jgi:hypothetical protein
MKLPVLFLAGIAALALSASPWAAEPVPERATGSWSTGGCGKGELTFLVNSRFALMIEGAGSQARVAVVRAEWADGSFVLQVKGEERERTVPLDDLRRCDVLPGSMSLLLADVVAVFIELGDLVAFCRDTAGITTQCATAATDFIDVSGDGVFSPAELRRATRMASFFIAYLGVADRQRGAFVSLDKLLIAQFAASVLGYFVVTRLIDSYDSDGDDAVSPRELLQGRSPEQAVQGILADLVVNAPVAVASMLMKAVPGFQPPADGD